MSEAPSHLQPTTTRLLSTTSRAFCTKVQFAKGKIPPIQLKVRKTQITHPIVDEEYEYYADEISNLYNPSLVKAPDSNTYWISFRVDCDNLNSFATQTLTLIGRLDANLHPLEPLQLLRLPSYSTSDHYSMSAQDLRLFNWDGNIYGLANDTSSHRDFEFKSRKLHLYQIEMAQGTTPIAHFHSRMELPDFERQGERPSKNWVPISGAHNHRNIFGYFIAPHHITIGITPPYKQRTIPHLVSSCPSNLSWDGGRFGKVRGGTPLIQASQETNELIAFFHGVQKATNSHPQALYFLGAYLVSPDNFCVTRSSPEAIQYSQLYTSIHGGNANVRIAFPAGLTHFDTFYAVSMGINDAGAKILLMNKDKLLGSLRPKAS
ncbi:MAG: hypothetical protein OXT67_07175 [Zetaproteobacteria bacterium]|nr:hypothetical protein [Zetaproteobacteria bacterium]